MAENIIYLVGNAFRVYIYWKLINFLFKETKFNKVWTFVGIAVYYLINSGAALMFENFTLNVITNIVPLFALTFLYETKISSKIFVPAAFYAVNMLADGIMYTTARAAGLDSIMISSGMATVLITFLADLLFEYKLKRGTLCELKKLHLATILTVPLGSIAIGILTMYNYSVKTIITAVILIIFNVLVFCLYDSLQKNYEAAYENRLLEQAIRAKNNELEVMKESQEKISFIRHDFKNHLISIEKYAENGDCKSIIEFVKNAFDFLKVDGQLIKTGNSEVDSIINYKLQEMRQKNVETKYSIVIPDKLKIRNFDINIVLGNLLNNAMEAMEKVENKKFYLDISFDKNILFIHMENTFNGKIKIKREELITTKDNKQAHGIGLKSVKNVLERYYGDMIFDTENDNFMTDVMLCNMDVNDKKN
ncbi:MAG: GHKL domain-containing protein [Clostridium sp.]|nr:GHKL domain-containing protein [Clostridium sp.]